MADQPHILDGSTKAREGKWWDSPNAPEFQLDAFCSDYPRLSGFRQGM